MDDRNNRGNKGKNKSNNEGNNEGNNQINKPETAYIISKLLNLDQRCLTFCNKGLRCEDCLLNDLICKNLKKLEWEEEELTGEIIFLDQFKQKREENRIVHISSYSSKLFHESERCPGLGNAVNVFSIIYKDFLVHNPEARACKSCEKSKKNIRRGCN